MHAIHTKLHGPTNTKGTRILAQYDNTKIVVPYDYALSTAQNHTRAAMELANRLGWVYSPTHFFSARLPDGSFAHIAIMREREHIRAPNKAVKPPYDANGTPVDE